MDRRRFLGLAAATGAVGTVGMAATGCGSDAASQGVTLKMIAADYGEPGGDNSSQGYWDALAREFHRKHPGIQVDVSVHSWNDVDKKVADMVRSGHAPDIAQIGAYADYAAAGKLYGVADLLSIPVQADLVQSLAEAGEMNRIQYGMPFASSTRLLFYNKRLFGRAGLDPISPPRTWGELAQAAVRLKSAGTRIPYGLPLGPEEAPAETLVWMLSGDGSYTDRVGNYTIASKANVKTFRWLRDHLVAKGLTNADPGGTNRQTLFDAFARGEVGMLNGHPTLMAQAARGHVSYGKAAPPGEHGLSRGTLGVTDWMMGFKQNGHRDEIGRFLDFVYKEENQNDFADRYDLLPVTVSASRRMRRSRPHRKLWRFLDQLSTAEFYPVDKVSWAQVSAEIKKSIGKAVADGGDPASVLNDLQRHAEADESAADSR